MTNYEIIIRFEKHIQMNQNQSNRDLIDSYMEMNCLGDINTRIMLQHYLKTRKKTKEE